MAKTESTAVNELISNVRSRAVIPHASPGDDLFASPQRTGVNLGGDRPVRTLGTIPPTANAAAMPALPVARAPSSTPANALSKLPAPVRVTTAPPARASSIPPLAAGTPAPELNKPAAPAPVVTAPAPAPRPTLDDTGEPVSADQWFESSRAVAQVDRAEVDIEIDRAEIDETMNGTLPVMRRHPRGYYTRKLIGLGSTLAVVGVLVGGYFAFNGSGGKHAHAATSKKVAAAPAAAAEADPSAQVAEPANAGTESAGATQPQPPTPDQLAAQAPAPGATAAAPTAPAEQVAAPAPAAAASPAAPAAPAKAAKLVDVRIDSKPLGATVMLVDNGKTSLLGTTPVSATVDASRAYDVIFTLEGRPTQMLHLDAKRTTHLELAFGKGGASAPTASAAFAASAPAPAQAPAPAAPAAPAAAPAPHPATATTHHHTATATRTAAAEPAASSAPAGGVGGNGTLMVSSKPPCEIWIDGKSTGLVTPQRSISLAAGSHKITFVNSTSNIRKTVAVAIKADQPTKLIQNLMQ